MSEFSSYSNFLFLNSFPTSNYLTSCLEQVRAVLSYAIIAPYEKNSHLDPAVFRININVCVGHGE